MTGDRNNDFRKLVIMLVLTAGVYVFFVFSYITDTPEKLSDILLIVGFLLFLGAWAIAEIVMYRKKYFVPEDKDKTTMKKRKRTEKRKVKLNKTIQGKDMYEVCKKYMSENCLSYAVIGFILLAIFEFCMFIQKGDRIYRMFCAIFGVSAEGEIVLQPALAVFFWYAIFPIVGSIGFYIYLKVSNNAVKKLKQVMEQGQYDETRVNDDFMMGKKHYLSQGVLHIGANYVVCCDKNSTFICDIHEIKAAQKVKELHKDGFKFMQVETDHFAVRVMTEKEMYHLQCLDEMAADLIVEEFEQHGLFGGIN